MNPGDLYPLDYDNNGQIDQNDRVVLGSTDPKFYGGCSTDFSWKGLSCLLYTSCLKGKEFLTVKQTLSRFISLTNS